MPTFNQLRNKARITQKNFVKSPALQKCPQKRGRIRRVYITNPRKPNSAKRKVAKIFLSNGKHIIAKIAGSGYLPNKFAVVLIRGGGFKDTPNAKYTIIRGTYECLPLFDRLRRRSIYGVKMEKKEKVFMIISNICALFIICGGILGFLISRPSLLHWILLAEIVWIGFYLYFAIHGLVFDALNYIIWCLLMLCLATGESAVGLGLLLFNTILFNNFNGPSSSTTNLWDSFQCFKYPN